MRRSLPVEPLARSAVWCRRAAVLALGLAAAASVASKSGAVKPETALGALALAFGLAGLAMLLAVVAGVVVWRTGRPGLGRAVAGAALALLLLAVPAWVVAHAYDRPVINDISTDLTDPPAFAATPKARAVRQGFVHDAPSPETRQAQRQSYPDVQPLDLDAEPAQVYAAALKLVRARRWSVAEAQPPAPPQTAGHIDAVARTLLMGFADDVTIRITALGPGRTRVDLRSASRVGRGDLGANAARIEAFMTDLDDAVEEN